MVLRWQSGRKERLMEAEWCYPSCSISRIVVGRTEKVACELHQTIETCR